MRQVTVLPPAFTDDPGTTLAPADRVAHRKIRGMFLFAVFAALQPLLVAGQDGSDAEKVEFALSAAPSSTAAGATVMEWDDRRILREGSNGYFCFPTTFRGAEHPMCIDETWIRFL